MEKKFGYFGENEGSYVITNPPPVGEYEYIYQNQQVLLKIDQYGVNLCQANPPAGISLFKREGKEKSSPCKVYFSIDNSFSHNFDIFHAKDKLITFSPSNANYILDFEKVRLVTDIFVPANGCRVIIRTTFINTSEENIELKVMPLIIPYVNDLLMAPWDKPEWYIKTIVEEKNEYFLFRTNRYSAEGKIKNRRYAYTLFDGNENGKEISFDKIFSQTKNFSEFPQKLELNNNINELYAFSQVYAASYSIKLSISQEKTFTQVIGLTEFEDDIERETEISKQYFAKDFVQKEINELNSYYQKLFSINRVDTKDKHFDKFVNSFLPMQLNWVASLDRGWPTGMRGVRDSANDFMAMLSYDTKKCREIILHTFSCQRSDGWFPRQIPFGDSKKFDLRFFIDGGCFFTEFVYQYLTFTKDSNLLFLKTNYYDKEVEETLLQHLLKAMAFYLDKENIGEHNLVKLQGGDWLDTMGGAGLEGRGETVMVTCQLVMCLEYVIKILKWLKVEGEYKDIIAEYKNSIKKFKWSVNEYSFNSQGFYNSIFTDNGEWVFSEKDPDGEMRPYIPTNAYAIVSDVANGRENKVTNVLKKLKSEIGYKLFNPPFGKKPILKIGKMGTGDLLAGFGENGCPYNHGSQGFFLRALAHAGDYNTFYDVLKYALPYDSAYHNPNNSCNAPYAIVNVYQCVPYFYGRSGFSFLTGSVAMIERAIYNWMFGINYDFEGLVFSPCIPIEFENSKLKYNYNGKILQIEYIGFGSKIDYIMLDGRKIDSTEKNRIKDKHVNKTTELKIYML